MKKIAGKKIAAKILNRLKNKLAKEKIKPGLGVILVGNDKSSRIYVGLKEKAAKNTGLNFFKVEMSTESSQNEIMDEIKKMNRSKKIGAIIVQLPLPKKFEARRIISSIDPEKDVDGFHPENIRNFISGKGGNCPVFPKAIIEVYKSVPAVKRKKIKKALIVANSPLFGKIMQVALQNTAKNIRCKYILAKNFENNGKKISEADLVITACGKPNLINGASLKIGAIVIDGGITKKGKMILGDVEDESVRKIAGFISPVPGGVGPVTVATLMENAYHLTKTANRKR